MYTLNMNNDHQKPENEEVLDREELHEENKKEERKMHDHQNPNPNLGKGTNPIHHGQGNR